MSVTTFRFSHDTIAGQISDRVYTAVFGHIPTHITAARDKFLAAKKRWDWANEELRSNGNTDPEWAEVLRNERSDAFQAMRDAIAAINAYSPGLASALFKSRL